MSNDEEYGLLDVPVRFLLHTITVKCEQPYMEKKENNPSLMHDFKEKGTPQKLPMKIIGYFAVIILLGIGSGFLLARTDVGNSIAKKDASVPDYSVNKGQVIGSDDTKAFPDVAEGTLRVGGIEGEGAYHLERPGGETQNVYMTSSTVDLSQLTGKKVKVWGATQTAQTAGWLMDVGRVEVL